MDTAHPAQAFSHLSQDLGCSGLARRVVVLVGGLGGLISGLSDHRCHGGCVDVGEDAASHPLRGGRRAQSVKSFPVIPKHSSAWPSW